MNSLTFLPCHVLLWSKIAFFAVYSKSTDKKRKHEPSDLPDGSGWGDHIQLLQIYELWDQRNYDVEWCKENNLQVPLFCFREKCTVLDNVGSQ